MRRATAVILHQNVHDDTRHMEGHPSRGCAGCTVRGAIRSSTFHSYRMPCATLAPQMRRGQSA
eukprot:3619031-Pyramimonas_sp.AAC.1